MSPCGSWFIVRAVDVTTVTGTVIEGPHKPASREGVGKALWGAAADVC